MSFIRASSYLNGQFLSLLIPNTIIHFPQMAPMGGSQFIVFVIKPPEVGTIQLAERAN